jgi:lipoteichoic acid synthase
LDKAVDVHPLSVPVRPPPSAFWPCLWLTIALVGAKAVHWNLPELRWARLGEYALDVLVSSHRDVLFVAITGLVFQALLALSRRRPLLRRILFGALVTFGAVCSAYAVLSVQIFAFLRSPLTYPLLFLAGDMQSMRSVLGGFLPRTLVVALVAVPVLYLLLVWMTARRPRLAPHHLRRVAPALVLLVVADVLVGHLAYQGTWADRDDYLIVLNPHWEMMASLAAEKLAGQRPGAFEPVVPADLAVFRSVRRPTSSWTRPHPPRNLVVIVLESTGARYMSLYGSKYHTTPRLEREAQNALVFERFYAHVGFTANSMAAIALSIFPYMTWREYTADYPTFPGRTLAEILKQRAYRTAFLHSGDLEYVGQNRFLQGRGFDLIADARHLAPDHQLPGWGCEDKVAVDGFLGWLDQDRGRPFFAQIWSCQSHYPYEPSADTPLIDFFQGELPPDDYDLGRYLNTLRQTDAQLGRLFDGLRQRGLANSTLVVVTGDHGEAFGWPHRAWGHGSRLYEENVRVPLMIWNPRLFKRGLRQATIGGHIDLNPTIAELMGLKPFAGWHGRSLFEPRRPARTYFYAAGGEYLLGVREDDWKYIANVSQGGEELFNLADDPEEQTNVASGQPELSRRLRQRLAAWREYVAQHLTATTRSLPEESP